MPNPYTRDELIAYLTKSFDPEEKIFIVDMFSAESLLETQCYWEDDRILTKLTDDQFQWVCDQLSEDRWLYEQIGNRLEEITADAVRSIN